MKATIVTRFVETVVVWSLRALFLFDLSILAVVLVLIGLEGLNSLLMTLNLGLAFIPIISTILTAVIYAGPIKCRAILCGISLTNIEIRRREHRSHFALVAILTAQSWLVPASIGTVNISRQAGCLSPDADADVWQQGLTCCLHHTINDMCLFMIVAYLVLALVAVLETRVSKGTVSNDTPESIISKLRSPADHMSTSTWGKESSHLTPDPRLLRTDYARWLQRRHSVSSLKAIHPHMSQILNHPDLERASSIQLRLYSVRETGEASSSCDTPEDLSSASRKHSKLDIPSRGDRLGLPHGSNSCIGSEHSYMRSLSTDNVFDDDLLPGGRKEMNSKRSISPPPPAWSPSLRHAPLSADSIIRAFSTADQIFTVDPQTTPPSRLIRSGTTPSSTSTIIQSSATSSRPLSTARTSMGSAYTALTPCPIRPPPRAPGHVIRSPSGRPLRRPSLLSNRTASIQYLQLSRPPVYRAMLGSTPEKIDVCEVLQK